MAVSSETAEIAYAGNGSQTVFAVPFYFLAAADLIVTVVTDATGAEAVKTLSRHYSVSGAGAAAGGSVTMTTPPASGETLVIERGLALTQTTTFQRRDPFDAATVNTALDRARMVDQRVKSRVDKALRVPVSESSPGPLPSLAARRGRIFGFHETTGAPCAVGTAALIPDLGSALINASASIERVLQIDNVTAMKALAKPAAPVQAHLRGYYVAEDGGGGPVAWDPSATDTADDVEIFAPDAGGTGRWKRILEGPVTTDMGGVRDDDVTSGQRTWPAIHTSGRRKRTIRLKGGTNRITAFDEYNAQSLTVEGEGRGWTTLAPIGDYQTSGSPEANVLYVDGTADVTLRGFTVKGGGEGETNVRYRGIFITNAKKALIEGVGVHSCGGYRTTPTGQGIVLTYCEDWTIRDVWASSVPWGTTVPNPEAYVATAPAATLTPGATSGTGVTFTADASVFAWGDVGKKITAGDGVATITGYTSGTEVTASISAAFASTDPIAQWWWRLVTYDGEEAFRGTRELVVIGRQCYRGIIDGLHLQNPRDTGLLISAGANASIDRPQDIRGRNIIVDASGLPLVDANGTPTSSSYGVDCYVVGSLHLDGVVVRAHGRMKNGIYVHDTGSPYSYETSTSHCRLYGLSHAGIKVNGSTRYTSTDDWVDGAGPADAPLAGNSGIVATAGNTTILIPQVHNVGLRGIEARWGTIIGARIVDWDRSGTGQPAIGVLQKGDARLRIDHPRFVINDGSTMTPAGSETPISTPFRAVVDLNDDVGIQQRQLDLDYPQATGTNVYYKQIAAASFKTNVGFLRGKQWFHDGQLTAGVLRVSDNSSTLDVRGYETIVLAHTSATTITNIVASPGQQFSLVAVNTNSTLANSGNIVLRQGVTSVRLATYKTVNFIYYKTPSVNRVCEAAR